MNEKKNTNEQEIEGNLKNEKIKSGNRKEKKKKV